jgi:membrane peptidoglycan carboxypeptidase
MMLPTGVALAFLALVAAACKLPSLSEEQAHAKTLAQTSFLYAADGSLITQLHATENRILVPFKDIPSSMGDAAVAIEDRRFYQHRGIDLKAFLRALYNDATTGHIVEGGSTITQQLAKQLYTGDARTLSRKIKDAALAWQLERKYTKDQILGKYLNTVYFGAGAYGVEAAAHTYFSLDDASQLSLARSALLAGLIQSPSTYDPFRHPNVARRRRNLVLEQMREQGMISRRSERRAMHADLGLRAPKDTQEHTIAPYFVDYFKQWFLNNPAFGKTAKERYDLLFSGGLRIWTTLDPKLQQDAEQAVAQVLPAKSDPYGALTSLDPRTGQVVAMVGGRNYYAPRKEDPFAQINLATGGSTGRQAGSSFKPFTLVAALESGLSPSKTYPAPSSITLPEGPGAPPWHVSNAEPGGGGSLTIEQATIASVNTVYAQIIRDVGPEKVVEVAQRMGIRCCRRVSNPDQPLLAVDSAVLGANEVNTLEMASGYGTLMNAGYHVQPVPVSLVTDSHGNVLWRDKPVAHSAVAPSIIATADGILQKVVTEGTGTAANLGRPQIGKTGTGQEYRDAWFGGSVPQLTTVVWVGFPQGQISMQPPKTRIVVFGGTWPAEIWRAYMARAVAPLSPLPLPSRDAHLVTEKVDIVSGCVADAATPAERVQDARFVAGTEPTRRCRAATYRGGNGDGRAPSRG